MVRSAAHGFPRLNMFEYGSVMGKSLQSEKRSSKCARWTLRNRSHAKVSCRPLWPVLERGFHTVWQNIFSFAPSSVGQGSIIGVFTFPICKRFRETLWRSVRAAIYQSPSNQIFGSGFSLKLCLPCIHMHTSLNKGKIKLHEKVHQTPLPQMRERHRGT